MRTLRLDQPGYERGEPGGTGPFSNTACIILSLAHENRSVSSNVGRRISFFIPVNVYVDSTMMNFSTMSYSSCNLISRRSISIENRTASIIFAGFWEMDHPCRSHRCDIFKPSV